MRFLSANRKLAAAREAEASRASPLSTSVTSRPPRTRCQRVFCRRGAPTASAVARPPREATVPPIPDDYLAPSASATLRALPTAPRDRPRLDGRAPPSKQREHGP